jgi:hypothetical protein
VPCLVEVEESCHFHPLKEWRDIEVDIEKERVEDMSVSNTIEANFHINNNNNTHQKMQTAQNHNSYINIPSYETPAKYL